MTEWKQFPGRENYMVSDKGDIKNIKTNRILKQSPDQRGYSRVSISNGASKNPTIAFPHRLVAELFIPKEEGKPVVNHKNGIKTDPRKDNLEWVTYKENTAHAIKTGLVDYCVLSKKANAASLAVNSKPVKLHDVQNDIVLNLPSISAAARHLGVRNDAISRSAKSNREINGYKIIG